MKTLMMKLKVLAAVVAGVVAFGAQAKIRSSITAVAPDAFVPLEGNILSGVIVDSAPGSQNESATNPKDALTDGKVGFGYSGYTYFAGSFVYTLGDAELGYDADILGYPWYRNAENGEWVPQVLASKPIRYTRTAPTMIVADVTVKKIAGADTAIAVTFLKGLAVILR